MKTAPKLFFCFALAALLLAADAPAFAAANIVIVNVDGAGEGFNDPTGSNIENCGSAYAAGHFGNGQGK